MLDQRAIDAYLARPFADWSIYKKLNDQRLTALADKRGIDPILWRKLRRHQRIMLLICLRARRFALWADTGTGKTITMLAMAAHLARTKQLKPILVLVPRKANKAEWQLEIEKHAPSLSFCVLPSRLEDKWRLIEAGGADITIETYSGLYQLACEKVPTKKGKNKLKPSKRCVDKLIAAFGILILDESHNAKTHDKLPFRICRKLAVSAEMVFTLSGTPHGRDPTDLWGQMMIVDGGETLGETLGLFRSVFFAQRKGFFGFKYDFLKHKTKLLHSVLNNRSIRFEADEADLPKLLPIIKKANLPDDAHLHYQRAREKMMAAGNYSEIRNAWLRLRQISSGFVGFHDDEAGKSAEFEFEENPKLDLLLSLLEGIHDKSIVFYEYTWSGLRIARELKKLGIGALHMYGGCKDQAGTRRRFADDPNVRVLILQNSFGEGLNLQAAKYGIFYESPVSPITRKQCVRRFERQQSAHRKVIQYDLVCRDTVDERILAMLAEGQDLLRAIIDGKGKTLI